MDRKHRKPLIAAAAAALLTTTAIVPAAIGAPPERPAAEHRAERPHHKGAPGARIGAVLLRREIVAELASRTGRDPAEVGEMMRRLKPHALAEELGLEREQMRDVVQAARQRLIDKLVAANLLSAEEAAELSSKPERRGPRPRR